MGGRELEGDIKLQVLGKETISTPGGPITGEGRESETEKKGENER